MTVKYKDGGLGMVKWCNDNVCVPLYHGEKLGTVWVPMGEMPDKKHLGTGRSYLDLWKAHQDILCAALEMNGDALKHRLIVFCWPRGQGKSFVAVLIQLWKFFNWPRQQIMLGANSKDQVKFVHFDIMRDIIFNSPNLIRMVGKHNIQEKEIRIRDKAGQVRSLIRSISSFSGIVSNITGYTFSEIFDMKNHKFFVQLDGSTRWVPNALGVIDSTVSSKNHVLYQLYRSAIIERTTKEVFFDYRCSLKGNVRDYWHPLMNQEQIDDYKVKFPFGEFERYFLNLWEAGYQKVFTEEMIREMEILSFDGKLMNHVDTWGAIQYLKEISEKQEDREKDKTAHYETVYQKVAEEYKQRFTLVESVYSLKDAFGQPDLADLDALLKLGDLLDTDWAILAGGDFSDPMATKGLSRTVTCVVAKGLPGSRSDPFMYGEGTPKYVYFVIGVDCIRDASLTAFKESLDRMHVTFEDIDVFCMERYGAWDFNDWCTERGIVFDPVYPNYERQKEAFKEVYVSVRDGRLKCPKVYVQGSKEDDILREEMAMFDHEIQPGKTKGRFFSPEKFEKGGVQDDSLYALAWAIYGGRTLSHVDFRKRGKASTFGFFIREKGLQGDYS